MAKKGLILQLSFKGKSKKEVELFKFLSEIEDKDEIKQELGEIYLPELYMKRSKRNVDKKESKSEKEISILDF